MRNIVAMLFKKYINFRYPKNELKEDLIFVARIQSIIMNLINMIT